jgi:signal peptidase I
MGRLSAVRIIAAAAIAALAIKLFALDLIVVSGESMIPTIRPGAVALVSRSAYGIRSPLSGAYLIAWAVPAPGDIVLVARGPGFPRRAVKRVFEAGPAFLQAEAGMLRGRGGAIPLGPAPTASLAGAPYVPAGRAFIVGDNPGSSYDSRDYGSVPIETILGKVLWYRGGRSGPALETEDGEDAAGDGYR